MRRGQISMEYIMLVGVVMVFFLVMTGVLVTRLLELNQMHMVQLAEEMAHVVENEINMAFISPAVYNRTILLPALLEGKPYTIENGSGDHPAFRVSLDTGQAWRPESVLRLPQAVIRWGYLGPDGEIFPNMTTKLEFKSVKMDTAHILDELSGEEQILVMFTALD